ncbi:ABC transporter substrate-binding protein [Corynebacterium variabile]|uniref:ABC transporter substrate-binding protein n=1 Tax=Corynebacterium variabile TaxID=1727 RepID=UPI001DF5A6ED|nr:ABC transporter substrate-binding protein [Corynebacterium variabile]HJG45305.1 ABC transporter substrate-binding protein [Corynebacterium variabile]
MHLPSLARSTSRRSPRTSLTAVVVAAGLVITGCSSDEDNSDTSGTSASADASEVTINHVYGEDNYPTNPETVVAIGTAVDNLLALGITPDAIVERPDDKDAAWKNDQLEDVERIPLSDQNVPLEEIAALEPDLVVGDLYRIPEESYDALKDVSPVLPGIDQTADWEPQLKALGQIYGKEDEAQQVIDDEQAFADVREELPGLDGKTALTVQDPGGQFGVIADPDNIANSFYSRLGMTLPEAFTDGSLKIEGGRVMISYERVDDLAADFMGMYATEGMEKIRAIAGYEKLPQVESGAVVEDDKSVMAALNIPSSLSNAWLLNTIKDQLKTAAEA